jgi:hypothetical protein
MSIKNNEALDNLLNLLGKRIELEGKVNLPKDVRNSGMIKIEFYRPKKEQLDLEGKPIHPIGGVGIYFPPGVAGNFNKNSDPTTLQIVLLKSVPKGTDFSNAESSWGYNPFGYYGMINLEKRFYNLNVDGLVEEILKLIKYLSLPLSAFPVVKDDDDFYDESLIVFSNDQNNDN